MNEETIYHHEAPTVRLEQVTVGQTPFVRVAETDVETLERAGESLIRAGHTQTAIELLALALRLRTDGGFYPKRRSTDAVT